MSYVCMSSNDPRQLPYPRLVRREGFGAMLPYTLASDDRTTPPSSPVCSQGMGKEFPGRHPLVRDQDLYISVFKNKLETRGRWRVGSSYVCI